MATFTRNINYYNYKHSTFLTIKKWAKVTPVYGMLKIEEANIYII